MAASFGGPGRRRAVDVGPGGGSGGPGGPGGSSPPTPLSIASPAMGGGRGGGGFGGGGGASDGSSRGPTPRAAATPASAATTPTGLSAWARAEAEARVLAAPPVVASEPGTIPTHMTSVVRVSAAEEMNARFRSTMEDAFVVLDGFGGDPDTGFFAIYDGHGGRSTAEYLRTHLHDNIERELHVKGSRSVEECLKTAFLMTDIEFSKSGEAASGSTAVGCIIRRTGPKRYVYTANCGDARAVLCHDGRAVRLSLDHKPSDASEEARIQAMGGFVTRGRVMGVLAVTRSFGDFTFKKYITAEPYTSTTKLDGSSQFLIIACDGVWDVLDDQEAVDLVREHLSAGGSAGGAGRMATAARVLVDRSMAKGTTDNVTAIVVFL